MTRQLLSITFPILVFVATCGAACGPAPISPRAVPQPPPEPAPIDARSSPPPETADGGTSAPIDSGSQRPKLPAPDAGSEAPAIDAGVETASARPPAPGEIRIVEVLVNPAGQDTGREWIEIVSLAAEPLDLSALHVADAAVDAAAPAGVMAPGARLLLGQLADGSKNGGAPVAVAYGTRLAFNNDGEEIAICVGACAGGVAVDRVAWKTLGAGYDGHALVFDHDANLTCPAAQPFGTAGDFGTPGDPNAACADLDGGL